MQSLALPRLAASSEGKAYAKEKKAIYVDFVPNMRAWAFWILEDKNIIASNHA